jgi:hypothetical protein
VKRGARWLQFAQAMTAGGVLTFAFAPFNV